MSEPRGPAITAGQTPLWPALLRGVEPRHAGEHLPHRSDLP